MPQHFTAVQQVPPAALSDTVQAKPRATRYGDLWTSPLGEPVIMASEAAYYTTTNVTWGGGTTMGSNGNSSFNETRPWALWRNFSTNENQRIIYPHFMLVTVLVAPTDATSYDMGLVIDVADRYVSSGQNMVKFNTNSSSSLASVADIKTGVVVASTSVKPKQIARWTVKTAAAPCLAVGDSMAIVFGHYGKALMGPLAGVTTGVAASQFIANVPPVALYPFPSSYSSLLAYSWGTAQTASPNVEFSFGWWER